MVASKSQIGASSARRHCRWWPSGPDGKQPTRNQAW